MMQRFGSAATAALVMAVAGCGIGRTSMLFTTNTSVGLDIDSTPPTTSLAYNRQELMVAPEFRDGEVLPAVAGIVVDHDAAGSSLGFGTYQSFVTGNAAVTYAGAVVLADKQAAKESHTAARAALVASSAETSRMTAQGKRGKVDTKFDGPISTLHDSEWAAGVPQGIFQTVKSLLVGESVRLNEDRPYFFGTNTTFGVGIQYTGASVPRAVNIGLKRQELALVPIVREDESKPVRAPSLLALSGVGVRSGGGGSSGSRISSVFATGAAADLLAQRPYVNQSFGGNVNDIAVPPTVTVAPPDAVTAPDVGTRDVRVSFVLSRAMPEPFAVAFAVNAVASNVAQPAFGVETTGGVVSFAANRTTAEATIRVAGAVDAADGLSRSFDVRVVPGSHVTTVPQSKVVWVVRGYGVAPRLTLTIEPPATVTRGATATANARLTLSKASAAPVRCTLVQNAPVVPNVRFGGEGAVEFAAGQREALVRVDATAVAAPAGVVLRAEIGADSQRVVNETGVAASVQSRTLTIQ